jgi:hypothetical protein
LSAIKNRFRGRACALICAALAACATVSPGTLPPAPEPAAPLPPQKPQAPPTVSPNPASNVNLQGFPLPYRQGYADGCASIGDVEHKDATRFQSDGQYRTGWSDGFALCKKR